MLDCLPLIKTNTYFNELSILNVLVRSAVVASMPSSFISISTSDRMVSIEPAD